MIKLAIFDMDGLLTDSEPLWNQANREVYKTLGIEITDEIIASMMGMPSTENAKRLYRQFGWEGPSPEEVSAMIVDNVIEHIKQGIELMPGVHSVLQMCKQARIPIAIASSSPSRLIDAVVDTVEIREHFSHIYSAQYEQYGKPHPGVFIKVAEHFKLHPTDCLVFEDSPVGVLAAKAASMHCVAVPHPNDKDHKYIQAADLVLDSLAEFDAVQFDSF